MKTIARTILDAALVCFAYGCASSPAAAPASPPVVPVTKSEVKAAVESPTAKSESTSKTSESTDSTSTPPAEPSPFADGLRKASRPPVQLITNPAALYVFNFGESEVGNAAREKCEASSETPSERSDCLEKARSKVPVESLRFVKKGNEYWWITLNRYRGNLLKWHVIQFQIGEEKSDRVTLKPVGKDKGMAPMGKLPRTLEIELPNDYSIALNDPEFGKMVFDEKIGKIEE